REVMTIESSAGRWNHTRTVEAGLGSVAWVPTSPGRVRVSVAVEGGDGSRAAGKTEFRVLSPGPSVRLTHAPRRAGAGRPVRFAFKVKDALSELAEVSTRDGVSTRRYRIRTGTGLLEWTPTAPGRAQVRVSVRGRDGQTATDSAMLTVSRAKPRNI